jgi:type 1 fimbriae regulatory protein FimB/type 1 fimbriae regulatory protein FimE
MAPKHRSVKSVSQRRRISLPLTVDRRGRDFLTEAEMQRFLEAARHRRHGVRDYLLLLLTYRHGLRVSEAIDRP